MTREEAKRNLEDLREYKIVLSDIPFNDQKKICDLAISALSEELSEDGTLTVHVSDGSKVKRVFVMGDNIFGGLYYPDSAENKGDLISRQAVEKLVWEYLRKETDENIAFYEHFLDLPTYSFPDSAEKGEWIPVSERLPEVGHVVYCQLTDGSHEILFLDVYSDGQMTWVGRRMRDYKVTAWREMPEPYKGE